MNHPASEITLLESYRHYRITLRREAGQWRYLCHHPSVLEGFSNDVGYSKPLSARTAARAAINLEIALQSTRQVLDAWLRSHQILHQEYMQALNQLYFAGKQLSK